MSENRRKVLDMLSEGKITVDEAERLLALVDVEPQDVEPRGTESPTGRTSPPKYLRVLVEPTDESIVDGERVNIRIPMALVRAGMRLPAVLPPSVAEHVNTALKENGIDIDVRQFKASDLDELVNALKELEVDVQDGEHKVRVYVE